MTTENDFLGDWIVKSLKGIKASAQIGITDPVIASCTSPCEGSNDLNVLKADFSMPSAFDLKCLGED